MLVSGSLSETPLWELTASQQTSNFAKQTVSLSQDMATYDFIKFVFRLTTSNASSIDVIYKSSDVLQFSDSNVTNKFVGCAAAYTSNWAYRRIYYISNTSVRFTDGILGTGTNNSQLIPLGVYGLK